MNTRLVPEGLAKYLPYPGKEYRLG